MEHFLTPHNENPSRSSLYTDEPLHGIENTDEKNITSIDSLLHNELHVYLKNDRTISGRDFLKLFQYAASLGISDAELKAYLIAQEVTIDSKHPPEELNTLISYH